VSRVRVRAGSNIALVKYWGKRDVALNLPATGSISVTLGELSTETEVELVPGLARDEVEIDGRDVPEQTSRVVRFLDRIRARAGIRDHARVTSHNNFPTGAGLASSASGFAALALAASRAAGLLLEEAELSVLARLGSGSAPRSLHGGFVEMMPGVREDGTDAVARPLFPESHWPLVVTVVVTAAGPKSIGSTAAMELCRSSSPYYDCWVRGADGDLAKAREAIAARDFSHLAAVAEHSCLKMHAAAMTSRPATLYWNGATVELLHWVQRERQRGEPVFFTVDAGPQVKIFSPVEQGAAVASALKGFPGVERVLTTGLGPGAHVIGRA
jgi:diphosphomevalonate decarboxylase